LPHTEDNTGPFEVIASITDRVGVNPAGLWLIYRANGGGWITEPLTPAGAEDTYHAFIPGQPIHSQVEYYLSATGTNGFNTALPYQGETTPFSFSVGPWRHIDYLESPMATIPDGVGSGTISVINVPPEDSGFIMEVTVDIAVSHPDQGELTVLLTGPDATEITLHDHTGGGTVNLTGNWPANLTVDGPGSLDDYGEQNNKGDWTLQVVDNIPGNEGTLLSWGLHFTLARYATAVEEEVLPRLARLGPNVPNPFNPRTEISYELARDGQTRLAIFDVRGMLVRRLVNEDLPAGLHTAVWDGNNESGRAVSSGTYLYRLESGTQVLSRKMQLVR
jgi:subtilisin-like proprotein convertase family protein